ncbi:hypothetical protein [Enterococcus hulanensis]|uniref:hypothetical protein n=1 Tax=Enterococcus hulanensis TaxID=2559929 RepID=UPI0010F7DB9A|nr:hypothetical protein [Enterococcus hulanensis]
MAKTNLTKLCESALWRENDKQGIFGCFEVAIGYEGKEIVDFITYKTTGELRCYEIKVTKADFKSRAKLSFYGDYNYYVMPVHLYEELKLEYQIKAEKNHFFKDEPKKAFEIQIKNMGVGILLVTPQGSIRKGIGPKRKSVNLSMRSKLIESMVRSLNREVGKFYKISPYWGDDVLLQEQLELIND